MVRLSGEEIDGLLRAIETDGYAVVRNVVSKDRLEGFRIELSEEFERVRSAGQIFRGGGMLTGHLNCYPGAAARFIYEELEAYGVVDLAQAYDLEASTKPRVTLNFNLPGSVAQHYHMDGLYTDAFLICNVAVVDTDEHNGAIDLLPGTNREFIKFWQYAVRRKYLLSTRVQMRQGDMLLRLSTTWHRGMPNASDAARPMAALTFGETGAPRGDPFAVNEGRVEFYPNWYRPTRLGRLRERTYKTAPITYSAYRFVRSLHGNKGYESF